MPRPFKEGALYRETLWEESFIHACSTAAHAYERSERC